MPQTLSNLHETASQTAGPFVHIGLAPGAAGFQIYDHELGHDIAGPAAAGERIRVEGHVIDGLGLPVKDVLIEIWQANAAGHYAHPEGGGPVEDGFRGWGRVVPDFDTGAWAVDTIKPSAIPGRNGTRQAPHLNLWLIARGVNIGLNTRMYFADEPEANAVDPVLRRIEGAHRRATLVAQRDDSGAQPVYRFKIALQGTDETVFFDI